MRKFILAAMAVVAVSAFGKTPAAEPVKAHFAWGAEAGSTVDLSGHDMSSVDFNASCGLSHKWISFLGVGTGANIMVSNSCRTYPVFAVFRTDFSNRPSLMFMDLRGGLALNYIHDYSQRGAYASAAIGFNLAMGRTFRSYITAGYTFISRKDMAVGDDLYEGPSLHMASIRLGISF